eukprot:scaffold459_cov249-Pinguiococcus_pyrenoidosus.AAC.26
MSSLLSDATCVASASTQWSWRRPRGASWPRLGCSGGGQRPTIPGSSGRCGRLATGPGAPASAAEVRQTARLLVSPGRRESPARRRR